jgi:hypothetical protein
VSIFSGFCRLAELNRRVPAAQMRFYRKTILYGPGYPGSVRRIRFSRNRGRPNTYFPLVPGVPETPPPLASGAALRRFHWLILAHPRFGRRCLRLFATTLRSYILPQFSAHRRVRVALDTELDAAVPFDASWLGCYLGFVRLWQGSLGWLHLRFGDRALPEMEGFLEGLESLFLEAAKVFALRDSTLAGRPGPRLKAGSLLIHAFDRNAYCFPSLHVMIVRYTHLRLTAAVARLCDGEGACPAELAYLEERAMRIVESIIHVKQHSVSDIPAALFLLHSLGGKGGMPEADRESDIRFLDALFRQEGHGREGARLRGFMRGLYERLHAARLSQGSDGTASPGGVGRAAHEALADFLGKYEEEVAALMRALDATGGSRPNP